MSFQSKNNYFQYLKKVAKAKKQLIPSSNSSSDSENVPILNDAKKSDLNDLNKSDLKNDEDKIQNSKLTNKIKTPSPKKNNNKKPSATSAFNKQKIPYSRYFYNMEKLHETKKIISSRFETTDSDSDCETSAKKIKINEENLNKNQIKKKQIEVKKVLNSLKKRFQIDKTLRQ